MKSTLEELRMEVSEFAMPDSVVAELLEVFSFRMRQMKLPAIRSDRERYSVVVEELCRVSRKIIWEFVQSSSCALSQVESAHELFSDAASEVSPSLGHDESTLLDYQSAIERRVNRLCAAVESYDICLN